MTVVSAGLLGVHENHFWILPRWPSSAGTRAMFMDRPVASRTVVLITPGGVRCGGTTMAADARRSAKFEADAPPQDCWREVGMYIGRSTFMGGYVAESERESGRRRCRSRCGPGDVVIFRFPPPPTDARSSSNKRWMNG